MSSGDKSDQKVIYINPTSSYGGDTHTLTEGYETKPVNVVPVPPVARPIMPTPTPTPTPMPTPTQSREHASLPIQVETNDSDEDSDNESESDDDDILEMTETTHGGVFVPPTPMSAPTMQHTSAPAPMQPMSAPAPVTVVKEEYTAVATPAPMTGGVHHNPVSAVGVEATPYVAIRSPDVHEQDDAADEGYMSGGDASSSISSVSTSKLFECDPMYIRLTQFLQASNGDNISNVLLGIQHELKRLNDNLQKERS